MLIEFMMGLALQTDTPDALAATQTASGHMIHAPDGYDISGIEAGIDQAIQHFDFYFDTQPPQSGVVYFAHPSQTQTHNAQTLGYPVYITGGQRNARQMITWQEAGLFIYPDEDQTLLVVGTFPDGQGELAGIQTHDRLTQIGPYSSHMVNIIENLRETHTTGDIIELEFTREGSTHSVSLELADYSTPRPDPNYMAQAIQTVPAHPPGADLIAHEITHLFLSYHFTPNPVPSWFQEGFASMAESPAGQAERLTILAQEEGPWLGWEALFSMLHPAQMTQGVNRRSSGPKPGQGSTTVVMQVNPDSDVIRHTRLFYPQSMSILIYLETHFGSDSIPGLIDWITDGNPAAEFVLVDSAGEESLLIDHEEIWEEWLDAQN